MASEESRQLRAGFVNDIAAIDVPIETQRREWEEAASKAILPPETIISPLVSRQSLLACARHYIGDRSPHDPLISPVYAGLYGLPPLLVHVGDHELLLSDS